MKLSKNFTLKEFTITSTGLPNIPSCEDKENLLALCVEVLQPLRDIHGKPIIIISGYRSLEVNEKVGGVSGSQHTRGEAVDIIAAGGGRAGNKILYEMVRDNFEYDQLINEYNYQWIHVSYTKRRPNRKQELKIG